VRRFLSILFLCFLFGCAIEDVAQKEDKQLVIAQNFMTKDEINLLHRIAKQHNIKLVVQFLSIKQIKNALQNTPWDPGFDLVFVDGLYNQVLLDSVGFQYSEPQFGTIPIGISYIDSNEIKVNDFKELANNYLWSAADLKSENILKLHFDYLFGQKANDKELEKEYQRLILGLKHHQVKYDNYQLKNGLLLCRYDTYLQQIEKTNAFRKFNYALCSKGRFYADYIGVYIVEQNTRIALARKFIDLLHKQRDSQSTFCQTFGMLKYSKKNLPYSFRVLQPLVNK